MDFKTIKKRLEDYGINIPIEDIEVSYNLLISRIKTTCNIKEVPKDKEPYILELLFYDIWIDRRREKVVTSEITGTVKDIQLGDTKVSLEDSNSKATETYNYMNNKYDDLWNELVVSLRRFRWW